MPSKRRYLAYLEPGTSSAKVPRQTVWSQRQKEVSAAVEASRIQLCEDAGANEEATPRVADHEEHEHLQPEYPASENSLLDNEESISSLHDGTPQEDSTTECAELPDPDADLAEFIRVNSEIILPNQATTRLQAMLLVLAFIVAAGIPWTQVDGLLRLLNAILGQEVFPSKYGLRKLWNLQRSKVLEVHGYCPTCQLLTRDCGLGFQRCDICENVVTPAEQVKKGSFFITLDLELQLLKLLKATGELVGKNLKDIATVPHEGAYRDITDGLLYRKVRSENNMSWCDLTLTMNTDGSPVFKSSKGSVWPIQVSLNELPVPYRWKNILVAAVWFAKEHPPAHLYLKTFVEKFNTVGKLAWSFSGQTVQSAVRIVSCCVDSPARAALLNAKQFNGYYGCSWCLQKGTLVDGTVKYIFEGHDMIERTSDMVVSAMTAAAVRGYPVDGIKGPSAVAKLCALDLVWGFPPDYLHCVLEGVASQLTELWLCSTGSVWYIGNRIKELNRRIVTIQPPIFFTRTPRPLTERAFWKATEWKFWLLYYGVPCLQGILPHKYLTHFTLLSHSVFLLLKTTVMECDIVLAGKLLMQFVQEMPVLYGKGSFTFNVHQLVHLAKSVQMTGPLWATSTFPFEGGNGDILKLVTAAKGVPQQIAERCIMQGVLKSLTRIVDLSPFLKHQLQLISGRKTKNHQSGVLGTPLPVSNLETCIRDLVVNTVGHVESISEYLRATIKGVVIHSAKYRRTEKSCTEYIEASDGRLCRIMCILVAEDTILLVCQELILVECILPFLYDVDHPPANVALCLLHDVDVLSPCVYVSVHGKSYVAKIPNLYERD
ncbi:uncharacterized protein LOC135393965 [Ornithodoros turicata]|uniref:uncharacterized protein LOC135393965 n=1 Tax=Ornithodoros turicata TaxID=34597 RepID=UPI00313996BB